jgi:hypothetical protein
MNWVANKNYRDTNFPTLFRQREYKMTEGTHVNGLRACLSVAMLLAAALLSSGPRAQSSNREREALSEVQNLQEMILENRREVERYHNEVQSLQNRVGNLESKLSILSDAAARLLAYGVVDDETITSFFRPAMTKPISNITAINIVKERPGFWTLTFVPPLKTKPVVLVSVGDASSSRLGSASVSELDERGFTVRTSSDGNVLDDLEFSFLVLSAGIP